MRKTLATVALTLGLVITASPALAYEPPPPVPLSYPAACEDTASAYRAWGLYWIDLYTGASEAVLDYVDQTRVLEDRVLHAIRRIDRKREIIRAQRREIRHLRAELRREQ